VKILAVDDEELMLWKLEKELKEVFPSAEICGFDTVKEVDAFLRSDATKTTGIEFAFLDINLGNVSGIDLARHIRELYPKCKFIFCTAYAEYALEAFEVYAAGYLRKPIAAERIRTALRNIGLLTDDKNRTYVRTFGNFDLFVDGNLVNFNRSKAKELLAYLVDRRGSSVTTPEAYSILWEDFDYAPGAKDKVQHVKKDLKDILCSYGIGDILLCSWNGLAVDVKKIDCDYYNYLDGRYKPSQGFFGEYMTQYSWAENTLGLLESMKR